MPEIERAADNASLRLLSAYADINDGTFRIDEAKAIREQFGLGAFNPQDPKFIAAVSSAINQTVEASQIGGQDFASNEVARVIKKHPDIFSEEVLAKATIPDSTRSALSRQQAREKEALIREQDHKEALRKESLREQSAFGGALRALESAPHVASLREALRETGTCLMFRTGATLAISGSNEISAHLALTPTGFGIVRHEQSISAGHVALSYELPVARGSERILGIGRNILRGELSSFVPKLDREQLDAIFSSGTTASEVSRNLKTASQLVSSQGADILHRESVTNLDEDDRHLGFKVIAFNSRRAQDREVPELS